jgi:uncharacterized protein (TIGR00369 family)
MENNYKEKTIKWKVPEISTRDANNLSGFDYLNSVKDGRFPSPPVAKLIGYRLIKVAHGHVVFELIPEECHYNPFFTVHGGILVTLLDSAMTASVLTTLETGFSCSTVEIKVNFIRPVSEKTGVLRCEAKPIHIGKKLATVQGRVEDSDAKLIAHGVSTCSIFRI